MRRLLDILFLAGAQGTWTASKLAQRLAVSERRIYQDLAVLRSNGFRIVNDREGYRLAGSILQLPVTLSAHEIIALLVPGRGGRDFTESARMKLAAALPSPLRELYGSTTRISNTLAISSAPESISTVLDKAVAENRRLRIFYQGNKDSQSTTRDVDPYGTFVKGTGVYLVGWCLREQKYKTYRTDRITSASIGTSFIRRGDFRLSQYVDDSPGVWTAVALDAMVEILPSHFVAMRSEARALGYRLRATAGGAGMLEIARGHLDETAWWLARFGEGIRVLRPPELRTRVIKIARSMLANHGVNERVQSSSS